MTSYEVWFNVQAVGGYNAQDYFGNITPNLANTYVLSLQRYHSHD